jgi:UDP-N-acetylmuramoyl-tripeptide--D-alanyl-D-alanine ligase
MTGKIKSLGRRMVCAVLESQVRRLRARHTFKVVAVVGSIGKTSTKLAIAHALEPSRRVMYQTGNYNDRVTVPLIFFGRNMPSLLNILAWIRIFLANERTIRLPRYYDVVVAELGTDGPGQMKDFAYIQPDLTIVTAITPEHMEFFKTLDAVAAEELTVCEFSKQVIVNSDDTPSQYLQGREVLTYGQSENAKYRAGHYVATGLTGGDVELHIPGEPPFAAHAYILGNQGIKILLAAAATLHLLELSFDEIQRGLLEVKPFAGRMQVLPGIKNSTIIDDTYNASPTPVIAAMDVLYQATASQRIAILGNMNELGDYSPEAHRQVGHYCDPKKLDLVITIGADADAYLAPAATEKGCRVEKFMSPYAAGEFVKKNLRDGAVVLAEGSQNGVFAEEALKPLLANAADAAKLVRQSDYWMGIKQKQFKKK